MGQGIGAKFCVLDAGNLLIILAKTAIHVFKWASSLSRLGELLLACFGRPMFFRGLIWFALCQ